MMESANTTPKQTLDNQEPASRATSRDDKPTQVDRSDGYKHLPDGMAEQVEAVEVSTGKPHVPGTSQKR